MTPAPGLIPAGTDLRDVQAVDPFEDTWLRVVRSASKLLHALETGARPSEDILDRAEGLRVALRMLVERDAA